MAKVIATERGYFGKELREVGASFDVPDDVWEDKKRRPKWAKLDPAHAFGGKGDHDGDGSVGGSKPASEPKAKAAPTGKGNGKGKAKPETVDAPTAEPFADPGEPVRVANEANDATGQTEPDWVKPSGDGAPVMAED